MTCGELHTDNPQFSSDLERDYYLELSARCMCTDTNSCMQREKNCMDYADSVRRCHTEFSHMGDLAHEIGAFFVQGMVLGAVRPCNLNGGYQHFGGTCSIQR